jgi:hypothetical protein
MRLFLSANRIAIRTRSIDDVLHANKMRMYDLILMMIDRHDALQRGTANRLAKFFSE